MNYKELIEHILATGVSQKYRNGIRRSVFGAHMSFNLKERFPLVQLKETKHHDSFVDLRWMISGSSKVDDLDTLGIKFNFWRKWAVDGDIGNLYGRAWRHAPNNGESMYPDDIIASGAVCPPDRVFDLEYIESTKTEVDQLANLIYGLKNHPSSSRHRISTYVPEWVSYEASDFEDSFAKGKGVITPCACFLHFTTSPKGLSLHVTQASSDVLIGLPVNIAQYAAFCHLVAREVDMEVDTLHYTLNDAHVYSNQLEAVASSGLLARDEIEDNCKLIINGNESMYRIDPSDMVIRGYKSHPFVKIPVSL